MAGGQDWLEEVAVLLVGWVGAHCGVRVRGRLIETWVVLGLLSLLCGSTVVVMRQVRLPVCLEDGNGGVV